LRRKAEPFELTIHQMRVMPDHVPLFVEGIPTIGVAEIVNRLRCWPANLPARRTTRIDPSIALRHE
jgi:hypothetical protein